MPQTSLLREASRGNRDTAVFRDEHDTEDVYVVSACTMLAAAVTDRLCRRDLCLMKMTTKCDDLVLGFRCVRHQGTTRSRQLIKLVADAVILREITSQVPFWFRFCICCESA